MNDFGIKYFYKEDTDYLVQRIKITYECTTDWNVNNHCGLTINWRYAGAYVDISMPKFVQKSLTCLQHKPDVHPQFSPHEQVQIK